MNNKEKKSWTDLSEIGEFGLIEQLTKDFNILNASTIKGIGDDAAILEFKDKQIVVTTDLLVEGIHFNLMYTPLKHLGYKAVAVNLSDVYAMNAIPKQITVSIAVSNRFSVEALEQLYSGIKSACANYKVDLIGGDTSSSTKGLIISITAIGEVEVGSAVLRSTAQVNDLICVTGDLGAAYAGLQLLERENEIFKATNSQPQLDGYEYIISRQLKPEPRSFLKKILDDLKIIPTAMIDISDGLSSEVLHICNKSNVGCEIYEDKIPIAEETIKMAKELNIEPLICALNGGEDYELLFTIPLIDFEKIRNINEISIIGRINESGKGTYLVSKYGDYFPLTQQGWNAYSN